MELRLSNNSSDSKLFEKAAQPYKRALKHNRHGRELKFTASPKPTDRRSHDPRDPCHNEPKKKARKRNVIWFNSSFGKNVATNAGNNFFTILSSCFPPNNKLHKIINKNTVKISYSCMNNVQQIINSHNKTILMSGIGCYCFCLVLLLLVYSRVRLGLLAYVACFVFGFVCVMEDCP